LRYPNIKVSRLPKAFFALDLERDIIPQEEKLISEYGFLKEEINFVVRYNAKFVLPEAHQSSQEIGIKALSDFLVKENGFEMEAVRTLVVRYPYVLSKSLSEFKVFFDTLRAEGL
jgi:hypothetical protein